MKRKMDSVLMMIFMLGFPSGSRDAISPSSGQCDEPGRMANTAIREDRTATSSDRDPSSDGSATCNGHPNTETVITEKHKETVQEIPFPNAPPTFHRLEKIEVKTEDRKNDAEIFWEVTKTPGKNVPPVVVNGNHPDNHEITTHDHVDKSIGHVPPTKRVKKILPPFEGSRQRTARHIDHSPPESSNVAGDQTTGPSGGGSPSRNGAPTVPRMSSRPEASTTSVSDNASDTPIPPRIEDVIQGIRLVPNEFGQGEQGEEEVSTMEKSIWDLLKEREQFSSDSTHMDGPESSANETEASTRLPIEGPKSLYDHFDADSEEIAFETENFNGASNIEKHELPFSYALPWLQMKDRQFDVRRKPEAASGNYDIPQDVTKLLKLTQNQKSVNGVSVSIINSGSGDYPRYGRRPSKWYLLLLTGNSTIVKLRRKDFAKYLKLNLAARLSVEYDDVKVNKVILAPPKVLVNISVFAPSDDVAEESQLDFKVGDKGEAPLYKLAETNATLLELSGEEYHVIRFLSLDSQKPEAEAHKDVPGTVSVASRRSDVEFITYTFVGSACACTALLTVFVTLNRYYKKVSDFAWFKPRQGAWKAREDVEREKDDFDGVSPAVIYSGGFPQIRGSWMTRRPAVPPFRQQRPSFDYGGSPPRRKVKARTDAEDRPCPSPRHNRLQIFNCDASSLLIPMPVPGKPGGKEKAKGEGNDTHPLDVRIWRESAGQDNPIFTN